VTTPHQGSTRLLAKATELRRLAPNVRDAFNLRISAALMEEVAGILEELAPLDPDIDSTPGEN
jgi:ArsR family metal-binding transcriptional regulator